MSYKEISDTGKTFDDYRNAIKVLKVKQKTIIAQNEEIKKKIEIIKQPIEPSLTN